MSIRNTFIVLVLLILVGGYAYYASLQPAEEKNKLFQIKADDISGIVLKYPDREIELAKEGGKWMIVKPVHAEADDTAVKSVARAVADCEVKKTLEQSASDLEVFGLDKPQVTVIVTTSDKHTMPGIEVGKTTPVGFSAYVKTTDKPNVLLTTSAFPAEVKKTVEELRNRQLVKVDVEDVQKITIERDGAAPIELDQNDGTWVVVKPAKYAADQTVVRAFLNALNGARIDEFVSEKPDSLSKYGLDRPRLAISVVAGKPEKRQSVMFGAKQTGTDKDTLYVRSGEGAPVYTVHTYAFADVNKSLFDLRDKTIMAFDPAKVDRMKFSAGNRSFMLERLPDGKWQLLDGASKMPADDTAVAEYLEKLRGEKGKSILEDPISDPKKFGMDAPTNEVTLLAKDGKLVGDLKLARVERRNQTGGATPAPLVRVDYYAVSSASGAVFELDNVQFDELVKSAKEFRGPTPEPTSAETPKAAASPAAAHPAPSPAK